VQRCRPAGGAWFGASRGAGSTNGAGCLPRAHRRAVAGEEHDIGSGSPASSAWRLPLFNRLLPLVAGLSDRGIASSGLDWPVLLFSLALSALAGVFFGVVPALRASAQLLTGGLTSSARTTSTKVATTLRGALVIG